MEDYYLERPCLNMETENINEDVNKLVKKSSLWSAVGGTILLTILIIFISSHIEETKELLLILRDAKPLWIGLGMLTEIATYVFAGGVWHVVARSANYHIPFKSLAELAVEELSINQLVPAGGVAGHLILLNAMRRLGLPNVLAMEVLFIDLLAYYVAFSSVTFFSLVILFLYGDITPIILSLVGAFLVIEIFITTLIWMAVNHKKLHIPEWVKNTKIISRILSLIEQISPERVFSIKLLTKSSLLKFGIFLCDAATLFCVMMALGVSASFLNAFLALVMASVAGAIIILPGGIGGFEAGCITTLILLGIPPSEAIASTLLFRGLSLWIPLIPGLILVKKDLAFVNKNTD
jgi:uncharacterized protein (TIRG00374 family)